jgi:hypothetical protein
LLSRPRRNIRHWAWARALGDDVLACKWLRLNRMRASKGKGNDESE